MMTSLPMHLPRRWISTGLFLFAASLAEAQSSSVFSAGHWFDAPSWLDATDQPLQWGRLQLQPSFNYGYSHVDGQPGRSGASAQSSNLHRFAPSLTLSQGEIWSLNYSPVWVRYTDSGFSNEANQNLKLNGLFHGELASGSLFGTYGTSSRAELETRSQLDRTFWSGGGSAHVPINRYVALQGSLTFSDNDTRGRERTKSWLETISVNTQPLPKLTTDVGATLGQSSISPGFDQKSTRYFVSAVWSLARKVSASGSVGRSERKVEASGASRISGLTYDGNITYQPFTHTRVSASLSRDFGGSLVGSRLTEDERATVALSQRLLGRVNLSVSYSVGTSKYIDPLSGLTREDDTERYSAMLSSALGKRLTASVFYRNLQNNSSERTFAVDSNEYGLSLTYRY